MKKMKVMTLLLAVSMAVSACGTPAKEETVKEETAVEESFMEQEFEFYSDDEHMILYNFPESMMQGGKEYSITTEEVAYETLGTRDTVQTVVDVNVEELEDVPETYTFEAPSGEEYELNSEQVYVEREGIVPIKVMEEIYYEDQIGKPSVPTKKMITYYDRASGTDKEIEGLLTTFEESTVGHWESKLNINGTFMAPSSDCTVYELAGANNVTVSRSAAKPTWAGYESDVLKSLKLDPKYSRVTDASWSGSDYNQDGYIMRNAVFTGDLFVSTYKAVYETERDAQGYATKVFYRVDADAVDAKEEDITTVYKIKAVVKYKLVK